MSTTLEKPEARNVEFELEAHGVSFKLTINPVVNNEAKPPPQDAYSAHPRMAEISERVTKAGLGTDRLKAIVEQGRYTPTINTPTVTTGIFRDPIPMETEDLYTSIDRPAPILPSASQQRKIEKILANQKAQPVESTPAKAKTKRRLGKRKTKKKAARKKS